MKIKDLVTMLQQYDPEMEVVVRSEDTFVSPDVCKNIAPFRHSNGMYYSDIAVVLEPSKIVGVQKTVN